MTDVSFKTIAERLKDLRLPAAQLVIGISEGGTVPAILVAYKLGCDVLIVKASYRDENNAPKTPEPVISGIPKIPAGVKRILLVDDVSVSGKTLSSVRSLLGRYDVSTLVFKGKADHVLFPEIDCCVKWPWK